MANEDELQQFLAESAGDTKLRVRNYVPADEIWFLTPQDLMRYDEEYDRLARENPFLVKPKQD